MILVPLTGIPTRPDVLVLAAAPYDRPMILTSGDGPGLGPLTRPQLRRRALRLVRLGALERNGSQFRCTALGADVVQLFRRAGWI